MELEPGHEAVATSTGFRICFSKMVKVRPPSSIRTLTARIHSAFSSVVIALHSFRTTGFVQVDLMYNEDTACADQRKVRRAVERSL
jgi:hypothetical protein